jgi:putative ABC transport system substrate-binding protein
MTGAGCDALYVVSSRQTVLNLPRIIEFTTRNRLPLVGGWGAWAVSGGLLSYGPNVDEMIRRLATYIDRVVKGAKPADLPVQQPTKFELLINAKTAKALGLRNPRTDTRPRRRGHRVRAKLNGRGFVLTVVCL